MIQPRRVAGFVDQQKMIIKGIEFIDFKAVLMIHHGTTAAKFCYEHPVSQPLRGAHVIVVLCQSQR